MNRRAPCLAGEVDAWRDGGGLIQCRQPSRTKDEMYMGSAREAKGVMKQKSSCQNVEAFSQEIPVLSAQHVHCFPDVRRSCELPNDFSAVTTPLIAGCEPETLAVT